eukprot:2631103-Heterocapsa_arctica.AAC.1
MGSWRVLKGFIRSRRNSRWPPWPPAVVPCGPPLFPVRNLSHLLPVHPIPCAMYSSVGTLLDHCWNTSGPLLGH